MANSWYAYLDQCGDPFLTLSYRRITIKPLCINGSWPCAVYLLGQTSITPTQPFTTNILTYIADGLASSIAQPLAPNKAFFYLKS